MNFKYNCPVCNRGQNFEGLCLKCKEAKHLEEALKFTPEQIQERQQYLIEHLDDLEDLEDTAAEYFWDCLSLHGVISEDLQRAALNEEVFYPWEIYYHAPEDVRDGLIECLKSTEDSMEASHLLECLAMQGDDVALETLYELKKNPPKWREKLYVDPDVYAESGGWTFDESGKRLAINYDKCYGVEKKGTGDKAVVIGKTREDRCPHCGSLLVDLISIDGTDKRLDFLGVPGKITATCCPSCICFAEGFSRFNLDGSSEACFPYKGQSDDEETYVSDDDCKVLENNGLELNEKDSPLFYKANDWNAVSIGGFAHWIQDCLISKCPDCGKPMRYLAQLSWETIANGMCEGTVYVEMCPDCKVTAMHHQQT